ncbi:MAG: DUF2336 domain-containing protein [Rickettsiales bacterium]
MTSDNAARDSTGTMILTASDVERLLKDDSAEARLDVLNKVSSNYNDKKFVESEREVAEQIFRLLMKDAHLKVRENLAQRIRENPEMPRDIVLHLANDHERVSLPILEASQVLSDADLINIIDSSREVSKLLAISKRPQVSGRVSDALVDTNYPDVVSSLVTNEGADISPRTYDRILDEFSRESAVMDSVITRANLPVAVVEKLISHATEAVAIELKRKYKLSDEQIRKDTAGTREDTTLRMLEQEDNPQAIEALVTQMAQEGRLTPSIIMTALCRGQHHFFVTARAVLARIPVTNAQNLVTDKGGLGFKALYERTEMPESMYDAVRLLLTVVQELDGGDAVPGSLLYANRVVERILARAGDQEVANLPYLMALVRQNVGRI